MQMFQRCISVLITMPDFDLPTSYITKWSEKLVKIGEKNGLTPIVLKGKNVNKNPAIDIIRIRFLP